MITAEMVRELRLKTGAGIMECKQALTEANENGYPDGLMETAQRILKVRGLDRSRDISGRPTTCGAVFHYVHGDGRVGVVCEVSCETDFVAKCDKFKELGHELCLHIAAAKPAFLSRDRVGPSIVSMNETLIRDQMAAEFEHKGKRPPENIQEKMLKGKMDKFFADACLLEQGWVKEPKQTIESLRANVSAVLGENIVIRSFSRLEVGLAPIHCFLPDRDTGHR